MKNIDAVKISMISLIAILIASFILFFIMNVLMNNGAQQPTTPNPKNDDKLPTPIPDPTDNSGKKKKARDNNKTLKITDVELRNMLAKAKMRFNTLNQEILDLDTVLNGLMIGKEQTESLIKIFDDKKDKEEILELEKRKRIAKDKHIPLKDVRMHLINIKKAVTGDYKSKSDKEAAINAVVKKVDFTLKSVAKEYNSLLKEINDKKQESNALVGKFKSGRRYAVMNNHGLSENEIKNKIDNLMDPALGTMGKFSTEEPDLRMNVCEHAIKERMNEQFSSLEKTVKNYTVDGSVEGDKIRDEVRDFKVRLSSAFTNLEGLENEIATLEKNIIPVTQQMNAVNTEKLNTLNSERDIQQKRLAELMKEAAEGTITEESKNQELEKINIEIHRLDQEILDINQSQSAIYDEQELQQARNALNAKITEYITMDEDIRQSAKTTNDLWVNIYNPASSFGKLGTSMPKVPTPLEILETVLGRSAIVRTDSPEDKKIFNAAINEMEIRARRFEVKLNLLEQICAICHGENGVDATKISEMLESIEKENSGEEVASLEKRIREINRKLPVIQEKNTLLAKEIKAKQDDLALKKHQLSIAKNMVDAAQGELDTYLANHPQ